jgi:fatty acid desaturase
MILNSPPLPEDNVELGNTVELGDRPFDPRQILSIQDLESLNIRSDRRGFAQLAGHFAIMGISGYLWATQVGHGWVALPALVIYGFSLAAMFAPMHECAHRTAFANHQINDAVAWLAGTLAFYNGTFYRQYHKWHHRYTQIIGKDPEISDPKPQTMAEYWLELSGLPWWIGKVRTHCQVARGQVQAYPFLSEHGAAEVVRSMRLQILAYAATIALSSAIGHPESVFLYWLFPLAVGQPILRLILLAEHTGCTHDDNPLTNTRTTLTGFPLRYLMWNMPFHAEHHLYPSIPFHALPKAHQHLSSYFAVVDSGYIKANRNIVAALGSLNG